MKKQTPVERMKGYKKELFKEHSVQYFLNDVETSDINRLVEEKLKEPIPATDAKCEAREGFIEKTKEIRKVLAIYHTIMDLLFFFSDCFPADVKQMQKMQMHKERVEKYAKLLNLKKKLNETYIEMLKGVIKDYEKVIIVVPMFPNVSIQSFSILSELGWLKRLIIDEGAGSLRENVDLRILFLNKPFLNILNNVDEGKREYFCDYRTKKKNMVKSVLDLNKMRVESFIKRYLTEFIVNEVKNSRLNCEEIPKIAQWLDKHVKAVDEGAAIGNFWDNKDTTIKITKENVVGEFTECDTVTLDNISSVLSNSQEEAAECYSLSDMGMAKLLTSKPHQSKGELYNTAPYEDILHYFKKISNDDENTLIIDVHSFRGIVLYDFYINEIFENNEVNTNFFGWDSYMPLLEPPILPTFHYLSTISKSYNFSLTKMYEDIVYNCDNMEGKYTICYISHFLEFLFEDVIRTFGMRIGGPKCAKEESGKKCGGDTIIVKKKCDECGTEHWMFECTSCWDTPHENLTDYLWLPMEIYYGLEKIFLDIPYTFMLAKREYVTRPRRDGEDRSEDVEKEFKNIFEKELNGVNQSDNVICELKQRFEMQRDYLIGEIEKNKNGEIN